MLVPDKVSFSKLEKATKNYEKSRGTNELKTENLKLEKSLKNEVTKIKKDYKRNGSLRLLKIADAAFYS